METPENRLVQVGAKVPCELAEAVAQLADEGNRSISREIRSAIAEHVDRSSAGSSPFYRSDDKPAERGGGLPGRGDPPSPLAGNEQ